MNHFIHNVDYFDELKIYMYIIDDDDNDNHYHDVDEINRTIELLM